MSFEYKGAPPKEESEITRRDVLKAGIAGAAFLLGARIFTEDEKDSGKIVGEISEVNNPEKIIDEMEKEEIEREQFEYEEGEMEYKIESIKSLGDLLDFDKKGPIRLDREKMEEVKNYWKEAYAGKNSELHKSLLDGYCEWGYWRKYTEQRFESVGIPIEYALLALPEPHSKVDARSKSGAVGPYQFMPETASKLNLKMNKVIDERRDPLKSAEACALVLKELHGASKDWNVALSGYNGGFAWRFIKEAKSKGKKTDYETFLKYLEGKLNKIKNDLIDNELEHGVKRGDNIFKIASFYGINSQELCKINGIKNGIIRRGQELLIPTAGLSRQAKKKIFAKRISGFSENLNYPAKFHAIQELIQGGKVRKQYEPINFSNKEISGREGGRKEREYIVAKGETLFGIARKVNLPPQKIYAYNKKIRNIRNLKPGDKILIPPAKKEKDMISDKSLVWEAKKRGKSVKEIQFLNPHVLNIYASLPNGTVIRV